jgi:PilZ domain-containing protein
MSLLGHHRNRRKSPRLEIDGDVQAHLIPTELSLTILDISEGGFAVASPIEFTRGMRYEFELCSVHCPNLIVAAANVHCLRIVSGGQESYVAGFQIVEEAGTKIREAIAELVRDIEDIRAMTGEQASYITGQ